MENRDKPAFPIHPDRNPSNSECVGLTAREYIAAMALQGLLANPNQSGTKEDFASHAVFIADALLTQLEKQ